MPFTIPNTYLPQFQHNDWVDNVDRLQAGGASGFNLRFHALEEEFDSIKSVMDNLTGAALELQNAVAGFQSQLGDLLPVKNLAVQEKIGIGTIAPVEDLHIQRSKNAPVRAVVENTSAEANAGTRFIARESPTRAIELGYINSGSGSFRDLNPNTAFVAALAGASFLAFNHQGAGPITFHTDDWHERMRITRDGNVGIGTTAPKGKLTLQGPEAKYGLLSFFTGDSDIEYDGGNDSLFVIRNTAANGKTVFMGGNIGIGTTNPTQKLFVEGDIHATGSITNGSSREFKENIVDLSSQEATETLKDLNPVKFNYKADQEKAQHIGFIAEEVPDLLATPDRKGLSPLDIVAVLTKVVKEQQETISALAEKVKALEEQRQ